MQNQIFRTKSLERVASPEQLNDYMRVTSPAIWMQLGAVIVLLAGLLVLASVSRLETTLAVRAKVDDGGVSILLPLERADTVDEGQTLRLAGQEVSIETVYQNEAGATVCTATLPGGAEDGTYDAVIVTDSISPISFLLN